VNQSAQAPTVNPPVDTRYRLTVRSNDGCGTSSDETQVLVFEKIKVPNTFTPNGDGYNDVWQIDLLDLFENSITEVYNTAGQLVHRSVGYSKPWDGTRNGKRLPAGTYYYLIDLKTNADRLTGYVTIIR
jgi:gliding motility-associated-like protein